MPKTVKKPTVTKDQWRKLLAFVKENFDSHQITNEDSLKEMAEAAGLTYERYVRKGKDRTQKGIVRDSKGVAFITVVLTHRDKYAEEVEQEGLGGWVAEGDWYGWMPLYMVEDLCNTHTKYRSGKLGRGSRYWDVLAALNKYVEELPDAQ